MSRHTVAKAATLAALRTAGAAITAAGAVLLGSLGLGHAQSSGDDAGEPELAVAMSQLQYFTHKLALSVEARNAPLAAFYLHEVEEVAEAIRDDVPEYDGLPIGPLMGSMLMPQVEQLEEALEEADWQAAERDFGRLIDSCNACHAATAHAFIVIQRAPGANPYLQSFAPSD